MNVRPSFRVCLCKAGVVSIDIKEEQGGLFSNSCSESIPTDEESPGKLMAASGLEF